MLRCTEIADCASTSSNAIPLLSYNSRHLRPAFQIVPSNEGSEGVPPFPVAEATLHTRVLFLFLRRRLALQHIALS